MVARVEHEKFFVENHYIVTNPQQLVSSFQQTILINEFITQLVILSSDKQLPHCHITRRSLNIK